MKRKKRNVDRKKTLCQGNDVHEKGKRRFFLECVSKLKSKQQNVVEVG